jgi:small subunit ribosomal protein S6
MVLKNYETVFILTPLLNEVQVQETVEKFRQVLKENGADIIHEENWGLKKTGLSDPEKINRFLSPGRVCRPIYNC